MSEIQVNTINEYTGANGVTIDGVLLKDGNVDGVDVSAIVSGSLVKLAEAENISAATDITFNSFVNNTLYNSYQIIWNNLTSGSDGVNMRISFRNSSSDITGTYRKGYWRVAMDASTNGFVGNTNDTDFHLVPIGSGTGTYENHRGIMTLYSNVGEFSNSDVIHANYTMYGRNQTPDLFFAEAGTALETSTALEGIKFKFSSGTISADSIYVYGVKK
jgi:hypothetical protein